MERKLHAWQFMRSHHRPPPTLDPERDGAATTTTPLRLHRDGPVLTVSGPMVRDRAVREAVNRAYEHLVSLQRDDGHFCGELEGCSILESEYVLLKHVFGEADHERAAGAVESIRQTQEPRGAWAIYPGGPTDVSTSVKAYLALKLFGDDARAPHMQRARREIVGAGGIAATNSYTRLLLAMAGRCDWDRCPAIPPEMFLLPTWSPFNIYETSSWSRQMLAPLSILWALKPVWPMPPHADISELASPSDWRPTLPRGRRARSWHRAFRLLDRLLRAAEGHVARTGLRRRALARAEQWMLARFDLTDGFGAIYPPIVYGLMALRALGYPREHPRVAQQLEALERLVIEDAGTVRLQPCRGPAWDTALALHAMVEARPEGDLHQRAAVSWLLDRESLQVGDWVHHNPDARPGGWAFQYENAFYPDCDDTAQILTDLAMVSVAPTDRARTTGARERATAWLLSMQNDSGGWAAFDKNCENEILSFIPFADHNAMLDPSCADITGRAIAALVRCGIGTDHPAIRRAVDFLHRTQEADGSWYGRWGCNYIYGTFLALHGLLAAGQDMNLARYQRAATWLRRHQAPDGGWGESLGSYDDPRQKGLGQSTSAQTAWALLGLLATGAAESTCVERGIGYLVDRQRADGGWRDESWTGTGFPGVFYLRYAYYDRYFPLLALATYGSRAPRPPSRNEL